MLTYLLTSECQRFFACKISGILIVDIVDMLTPYIHSPHAPIYPTLTPPHRVYFEGSFLYVNNVNIYITIYIIRIISVDIPMSTFCQHVNISREAKCLLFRL